MSDARKARIAADALKRYSDARATLRSQPQFQHPRPGLWFIAGMVFGGALTILPQFIF